MNYFKFIFICFFFVSTHSMIMCAHDPMGKHLGENAARVVDGTVNNLIKSQAAENFGRNFGLGTLIFIGTKIKGVGIAAASGVSKVLAVGKAAGVVAVSAPVLPYVLVGTTVVVVGYGVYRVYRYHNPTTGEIIEKTVEIARLDQAKAEAIKAKAEILKAKADLYEATILEVAAKKAMEQKMAELAAA